ncbi:MAG: peptidylprolyl isomerase [bacterium]|nr:peptidylprolyl isomerase [bacterium]
MRKIRIFIILSMIIFLSTALSAKIVEMIAAKVNGEIITLSELENELVQVREQVKKVYPPEEQANALKIEQKKMLNLLIENKLILQNAKKAGIDVSPAEVNRYVEEAITNMKKNFPDEKAFEDALVERQTNLTELRRSYRSRIEEELVIQRYVEQEVKSKIEVSEKEIDDYFEKQKEELRAKHILLNTEEEANAVLNELNNGRDFDELAKERSKGPSAEKGGDLGYFRKGDMLPEFEDKVFQMKKGEIAGPVKTQFGYHIIKLEDRRTIEPGERIHAFHIVSKTLEESKDLLERLKKGEDFETLAKEKSIGPSAKDGGDLGFFKRGDMVSEFENVAFNLKIGELSDIVKTDYGYHIIKVVSKETLSPDQVAAVKLNIKNKLTQDKMEKVYSAWVEKLKKEAVIEIKLVE